MNNFREIVIDFATGVISKNKVAFYLHRLSKENATRRLASILMVGLLVFQFFTFLAPPQSSSASGSDLVPGGFKSTTQLLSQYDQNTGRIHEILDSVGINRQDLESATANTWTCTGGLLSMGNGGKGTPSVNGTTVGDCKARWAQNSIEGIKIGRKVFADIGFGAQWYEVGILKSCTNLVFLPTTPPVVPPASYVCERLDPSSNTAVVGGNISFKGFATTRNDGFKLNPDALVNMEYQLLDSSGKLVSTQTTTGVRQTNGLYQDPGQKVFSFGSVGAFTMNLIIRYNSGGQEAIAQGSAQGECSRRLNITPLPSSYECKIIKAQPDTGYAPLEGVVLSAEAGTTNSTVVSYEFDFGDGAKQTVATSALSASTAILTYQAGGNYIATVAIKTSKGTTNPADCQVSIKAIPTVIACKSLTSTPVTGPIPLSVTLAGSATVAGADIESFEYDFGDESPKQTISTTSLDSVAKHTYKSPGNYTASITVITNKGKSALIDACKVVITPTDIQFAKTVANLTLLTPDGKPTDANNQVARAGDTLQYQIAVCNATSSAYKNFVFDDDITNLLYYTDVSDLGGSTKVVQNGQTKLVWPATDIAPLRGNTACTDSSGNIIASSFSGAVRSFTVKVKSPIPVDPVQSSDLDAYNCQITDEFHGKIVTTPIGVPPSKRAECAVRVLPETGAGLPIFLISFFAASSLYLFSRNRLLKREIELIETLNDGAIKL